MHLGCFFFLLSTLPILDGCLNLIILWTFMWFGSDSYLIQTKIVNGLERSYFRSKKLKVFFECAVRISKKGWKSHLLMVMLKISQIMIKTGLGFIHLKKYFKILFECVYCCLEFRSYQDPKMKSLRTLGNWFNLVEWLSLRYRIIMWEREEEMVFEDKVKISYWEGDMRPNLWAKGVCSNALKLLVEAEISVGALFEWQW